MLNVMILGLCVLWAAAGFSVCRFTHRQRGLDVDEMHVPDFVPPDWSRALDKENV